ncbi:NAD(P)H-binding protein [Janthinobacterium lividum]|nr:NAD(P)H-binding protein [Janthinobacterium lividum]
MICVTGATGQLGRLVIGELLKSVPAGQIVAAVRRPAAARDLEELGIVVRQADYAQPGHWPLARHGFPLAVAATLASADMGVAHGDVLGDSRDLSELIGRPSTSLQSLVAAALAGAKGDA